MNSLASIFIRDAKTADLLGIARVKIHTWRSTYRGLIKEDILDGFEVNEQAEKFGELMPEKGDRTFLIVAEVLGTVVGFAAGGAERDGKHGTDGEVYAVYVLKEFQNQGIGNKLMEHACDKLTEMGLTSMLVWVLEHNAYKRFYEKHGGVQIDRKPLDEDSPEPVIAAYAWKNLKGFK